jgi:hypothetical protein
MTAPRSWPGISAPMCLKRLRHTSAAVPRYADGLRRASTCSRPTAPQDTGTPVGGRADHGGKFDALLHRHHRKGMVTWSDLVRDRAVVWSCWRYGALLTVSR